MENTKKYKEIKATKPHSDCTGCNSSMLASTYETKEERDLLGSILDRLIKENA